MTLTMPLPEAVRRVLEQPGLQPLLRRLRQQLERNALQATGFVRVQVPDQHVASELGAIIGRRLTGHVGKSVRVDVQKLDRALREGPARRGLVDVLSALSGQELGLKRAAREARIEAAHEIRQVLIALMSVVPEMSRELALLGSTPLTPNPRVPPTSTSRTSSWSVYEDAIRAACVWWPAHRAGRKMAAKQLAGQAFRDTKKWTDQRRVAFANLVGRPFDQALEEADTFIKMSGPLVWRIDDIVADAAASRPWIAIPARGVRSLGYVSCEACGVLLVENVEAFEWVCKLDDISGQWLCVWSHGFASGGLIRFLSNLGLPLAAWCDLDADGIEIVADIERRVGQPVHPVAMSATLWRAGIKRYQTDAEKARARVKAAQLVKTGPAALRELATAVAETGDSCEQETLYEAVRSSLREALRELEIPERMGNEGSGK